MILKLPELFTEFFNDSLLFFAPAVHQLDWHLKIIIPIA